MNGARLARGGALLVAGSIGGRLIQAVAYALLARRLDPADFGTLALAAIAINALQLLPGLGLGTALLAQPGDPRPAARSAVTVALIGGGGVALLAALVAATLHARGAVAVAELVLLLAVALLFQGPGAVAGALLDRELRFGARVVADLLGSVAFLLASLAAAAAGLGAPSLAVGLVAAAAVQSLAAMRLARVAPTFAPELALLRRTAGLGALVVATSLLQWLFTSGDLWSIEQRFGRDAVGCYSTALQLATVPASALGVVSGRLALPALVRARESGAAATAFRRISAVATLLAALACALFIVAADPLIHFVYGDRFLGAAPLLPLVALGACAKVVGGLAGPALLAGGKARVAFALVLTQNLVALPLAALAPEEFGAAGVALVYSVVQLAACAFAFVVGSRCLVPRGALA